jgi:hypothetical protein
METCNNCNPCGSEEINLKFGEAAYTLFKRLKYGIATCCDENYELDLYNKELCDLNAKLDAGLTPTNFQCEGLTELLYSTTCNTITLTWTNPIGVTTVDIDYKVNTATNWTNFVTGTSSTTVVINGLTQGTSYSVRIKTHCPYSSSEWLEYIITTPECDSPESCVNISDVDVIPTCNNATVTWTNSTNTFGTIVQYSEQGSGVWTTAAEGLTSAVEVMVISDLEQGTAYEISLQGVCSQGNSTNEIVVAFETLSCPCLPATITLTPTCGTISVAWVAVSPVDSVEIEYQQDGETLWQTIDTFGLLDGSYTLTELNELTQFNFRVRTICGEVASEWIYYTSSTYECCEYRIDISFSESTSVKDCQDVCRTEVENGTITYRTLTVGILDCNNEPTYPNDVEFIVSYETIDCNGTITSGTLVYTLPAFAGPQAIFPYVYSETCCCYTLTGGPAYAITNILTVTNNAGL